jgi:hypothetical protein
MDRFIRTRNADGTSFVSKLGVAREGWRYLGFSLCSHGFVKIFILDMGGIVVAKSTMTRD